MSALPFFLAVSYPLLQPGGRSVASPNQQLPSINGIPRAERVAVRCAVAVGRMSTCPATRRIDIS